jgi:uncharacterized ubiquitin-like protein YukD
MKYKELHFLNNIIDTTINLTNYEPKEIILPIKVYSNVLNDMRLINNIYTSADSNKIDSIDAVYYRGIKISFDEKMLNGSITIKY